MICYRDMTFCPFWDECKDGKECFRALTNEVWNKAHKWWGLDKSKDDIPICLFTEKPDCFKEV